MTISFNTIPSNTLVPLFYAEMDNQAANTAQDSGASLLIGHANNGAEIVANSLVLMPSADYARRFVVREVSWRVWSRLIARPTRLASCM